MIRLLHHAVDRSAERFPDKDAFRFLDQSVTYRELSDQSSSLAGVLMERGVQRGDRVGVHINKSLETAIAIYGIMKAGAAFVPLDPAAPLARIRTMIEHCGISHLVTNENRRDGVLQLVGEGLKLDCIIGIEDGDEAGIDIVSWAEVFAAEPVQSCRVIEQDIAYIMYTSGSTGTPKGITHTHASGLAYAYAISELYDVQPEDRFGNHAPLHFDISTFDYFAAPLCGATTVIIPEPYLKLPASLSELMEQEKLTFWFSVPYALTQLLLYGVLEKRNLESLRWVLFGGEPFPPKHLRALMKQWPHARFSNSYGPAEVNMCAFYHVDEPITPNTETIPIGQMWDAAEGLIVNENDQPVGLGEQGELLVRSSTRMQGYWREPELNRRSFFHRSVTEDIQDVFYRTGDLVVQHDEATMLFLGRKDRQIKSRGYRIELDEIEFVLSEHPLVEEAAAYPVRNREAVEAAVTLKSDAVIETLELLSHAAKMLPNYAVPQTVRILATFPRTTSQKIDRRALSAMFDTD